VSRSWYNRGELFWLGGGRFEDIDEELETMPRWFEDDEELAVMPRWFEDEEELVAMPRWFDDIEEVFDTMPLWETLSLSLRCSLNSSAIPRGPILDRSLEDGLVTMLAKPEK